MKDQTIVIAKAIGIMLMVVLHAGAPKWFEAEVSLFHMPLFFIFSGWCFKEKSLAAPLYWMNRKFTGIYLKYVKYGLLFLIFHNIFFQLDIYNDVHGFNGVVSHTYSWTEYAKKAANVLRLGGAEQLLGGYWFLKELFWGSLIYYGMRRLIGIMRLSFAIERRAQCLTGGGICMLICLFFSYIDKSIPLIVVGSRSFMAATYIYIGSVLSTVRLRKGWQMSCIYAVVVFGISLFVKTSMLRYSFCQILPYMVASVSGTLLIYNISYILRDSENRLASLLRYTGTRTFHVLTWHFLSFKSVSLIIIATTGISIDYLACFPVITEHGSPWWVAYAISGIGLPLAGVRIYEKLTHK